MITTVLLNPYVLVIVDVILAPSPHPFPDVRVVVEELDAFDPLGHLEAPLRLQPEPQGSPVLYGQRPAVHIVGKERLSLVRQVEVYHLVELPAARRARFVPPRVLHSPETDVAHLRPRSDQLDDLAQRHAGPLAYAGPALYAIVQHPLALLGGEGAQLLECERHGPLHQTPDLQLIVGEVVGGHDLVLIARRGLPVEPVLRGQVRSRVILARAQTVQQDAPGVVGYFAQNPLRAAWARKRVLCGGTVQHHESE